MRKSLEEEEEKEWLEQQYKQVVETYLVFASSQLAVNSADAGLTDGHSPSLLSRRLRRRRPIDVNGLVGYYIEKKQRKASDPSSRAIVQSDNRLTSFSDSPENQVGLHGWATS